MTDPLTELKGIGPKTVSWLHDAGIHTPADLDALGAAEVFRRVKAVHPEITLNGLWGLQAAIMNLHWTQIPPDIKDELRAAVADVRKR